jgi:hypothetical protein
MKFDTFRVPPMACLGCGKKVDAATLPDGGVGPDEGDVTICFYCGHLMAFTADRKLRDLTSDEMHDVAGDPLILRMQRARAATSGGKKP